MRSNEVGRKVRQVEGSTCRRARGHRENERVWRAENAEPGRPVGPGPPGPCCALWTDSRQDITEGFQVSIQCICISCIICQDLVQTKGITVCLLPSLAHTPPNQRCCIAMIVVSIPKQSRSLWLKRYAPLLSQSNTVTTWIETDTDTDVKFSESIPSFKEQVPKLF